MHFLRHFSNFLSKNQLDNLLQKTKLEPLPKKIWVSARQRNALRQIISDEAVVNVLLQMREPEKLFVTSMFLRCKDGRLQPQRRRLSKSDRPNESWVPKWKLCLSKQLKLRAKPQRKPPKSKSNSRLSSDHQQIIIPQQWATTTTYPQQRK